MDEKIFWNEFKEKYGKAFKRKTKISDDGMCYIDIPLKDIVLYDDNNETCSLCGDLAEYIYDLEDIKEETLIICKKYDELEKKNIKLKAKITLLKQINELLRHEEDI